MNRTELGRIRQGAVYRYHGLRTVKRDGATLVEDVDAGLYIVQGFATDAITRRCLVVYRGLDGTDEGQLWVCTPADFAVKFRLEAPQAEPTEPEAPVAEKAAGRISQEGKYL